MLAPLISWAAPAARGESLFLEPSVRYGARALGFTPDIVVGDMAYINLKVQRRLRQDCRVAVITKPRADMIMPEAYDTPTRMSCEEGQRLAWLGLEERDQLHWFGVADPDPLCQRCWRQSSCPRQFSHPPAEHEIYYGSIPANSRVSQRLLYQCRPWIEAAQAYDKNHLGLGSFYLNSLPLAWTACLLTDTAALLRARAFAALPQDHHPLRQLLPTQLNLDL